MLYSQVFQANAKLAKGFGCKRKQRSNKEVYFNTYLYVVLRQLIESVMSK